MRKLAKRKNVQLNFLLSGGLCGKRNSYRSLAKSTGGAWVKMSQSRASRVLSFVTRALKHGATALRGLNRDGLSTYVARREKCRCTRVPRVTAKYSYVNAVTCSEKTTRPGKRCPRGFRLSRGRCVKSGTSVKRCPRGFFMKKIREKKYVGTRATGGFVKKCRCLGGKRPGKIRRRALDIAFVVDVTGSMRRVINGIKAKIREVIDANSRHGVVSRMPIPCMNLNLGEGCKHRMSTMVRFRSYSATSG